MRWEHGKGGFHRSARGVGQMYGCAASGRTASGRTARITADHAPLRRIVRTPYFRTPCVRTLYVPTPYVRTPLYVTRPALQLFSALPRRIFVPVAVIRRPPNGSTPGRINAGSAA